MENSDKNNSVNLEQIKQIKKIYFWRTAFFGLVILTAGIFIGGASMFIFDTHNLTTPPPGEEFVNLMPRLRRNLGLTQEQVNKIRPIMNKHLQKLEDIREDARVAIVNTLVEMNKEISPILAENQKSVWQGELIRLQNNLTPPMPRGGGGGGGARRRRGATEPPGPTGGRGYGARAQPGMGMGARRGFGAQVPPASGPNSPLNNIIEDINTNEITSGNLEPNDANE